MKKAAGILTVALALCVLQTPLFLHGAKNPAASQNPLKALGDAVKEKAAEDTMTTLLNNQLPLALNANSVYPTVNDLPGGPFQPTALQLTAADLDKPLAPGDYTIPMLAFCSEYSVHQPGVGVAYVLGPLEGKAADAIGALYWRGVLQYHIAPQQLETVGWAIQSGLTYAEMPKTYQAIIDQVIPDYKTEIVGDFLDNLESTYNDSAKSANLPPLDQMLAKMGKPGAQALDAEREQTVLKRQNTSDQLKDQTLFQGQDNTVYTPVKAEVGPWTERIPGVAYMRLQIEGGNLQSNNVMQIRIMPSAGSATARNNPAGGGAHFRARVVHASYTPGQLPGNAPSTLLTTVTNLIQGIIGYSMGKGAQALAQVPAVSAAPPPPAAPKQTLAGKVANLEGTATVLRNGVTIPLGPGDEVDMGDVVQTGAESRLEIAFQDNSEMTMGDNSKLSVDDFVFEPTGSQNKARFSWLQGAFQWLSSEIGKKEDYDTQIDVEFGEIGIRGTEFVAQYNAAAGTVEVDLINGAVDIEPKQAATQSSFTGPITIVLSASGAKTSPLTQAQYNAILAQALPPLPAAGH